VPVLERGLPTVATMVLLASSGALQLGVRAIRGARPRALAAQLGATLGLALGFLVLQGTAWVHMVHRGMDPSGSVYAACFFGLTCFHAVHALVGIAGLASLLPRARRGAFGAHAYLPVRAWATYWHFVGVVWVAFYLTVFA
jgi:cytochrome c oxidase subunit 3